MADILPEKWMKGVAITTTVLAVLTAIASSRSAFCIAQSQVLTALEGSKWAYYQAKSIKQVLKETQQELFEVDILGSTSPEQRSLLGQKLEAATADVSRYETEKNDIRKEAEDVGKKNALMSRQGGQFSLSIVFFQIGIMLSSVSALLKRKEMWIVGLIFGSVATVFLANGFLLFF